MRNMIMPALSTKESNYRLLDNLSVGIKIDYNPYSIPPECIFSLAARNNPKRSYLFVSKVIGKHIPVYPQTPFLIGSLLASRLAAFLKIPDSSKCLSTASSILSSSMDIDFDPQIYTFPGKALFIGFAETATALGHSVFGCFSGNTSYIHTTRENLIGKFDTLYFTEDHCHAPEQRCLISKAETIQDNDLVILIDDEITSGNTCLNIIRTIQRKYPQKRYAILTILDWRSEDAKAKYKAAQKELGLDIEVIPLLAGGFWSEGTSPVACEPITPVESTMPAVTLMHENMSYEVGNFQATYSGFTGRFGIDESDHNLLMQEAKIIGKKLMDRRKGKKTLCVGTGEFMYVPFLIAKNMGEGVKVQSTTRSPVHPLLKEDYAVKNAIAFEDPFRPGINNFIYNIPPNYYDEVFIFWERKVNPEQVEPLIKGLGNLGINNITFIFNCL